MDESGIGASRMMKVLLAQAGGIPNIGFSERDVSSSSPPQAPVVTTSSSEVRFEELKARLAAKLEQIRILVVVHLEFCAHQSPIVSGEGNPTRS
ncbi:hypothetical protein Droror1_Dr00027378 [Drosera rotundifolia]